MPTGNAALETSTQSTLPTVAGLLEPIRNKYKLPCLGAAVIVNGGLKEIGVTGVRKLGSNVAAQPGDLFHLGSCGKAMTATVIARLVEEGVLKWDRPLEEYFPDLKKTIHPQFRRVTLDQILTHRAGMPGDIPLNLMLKGHNVATTGSRQMRLEYVRRTLARAPETTGSKFVYSNGGYVLAAAIAENATGSDWEDLIREKLFAPLGMTSAGFGAAGDAANIDQPWPHGAGLFGGVKPIAPGSVESDNPPFLAPIGTVHCSLEDWAKFACLHLSRASDAHIVTSATLARLHSPPLGGDYAYGWGVVDRDWAGGKALTHAGSNSMNYAVIWLAPKKNFGILVVTNTGVEKAPEACNEAATALMKRYLKK